MEEMHSLLLHPDSILSLLLYPDSILSLLLYPDSILSLLLYPDSIMATVGGEMEEMHSLLLHPDSILSSSDTDKKIGEVMNELHDLVSKVYKNTK